MSQTEKEAIDAGTVVDADLFGQARLGQALKTPEALARAGVSRRPGGGLCAMCDEWEISHEHQDLPPHAWQFIKDKGFLGMIIPKQYGASASARSRIRRW